MKADKFFYLDAKWDDARRVPEFFTPKEAKDYQGVLIKRRGILQKELDETTSNLGSAKRKKVSRGWRTQQQGKLISALYLQVKIRKNKLVINNKRLSKIGVDVAHWYHPDLKCRAEIRRENKNIKS